MHIYHAGTGLPVAVILRRACTPSGREVAAVIEHLSRRIKKHWPNTRLIWRGDSHYGRADAIDWCEDNTRDYIFGFAGNAVLDGLLVETAETLRWWHAHAIDEWGVEVKVRCYKSLIYKAKSWSRPGPE